MHFKLYREIPEGFLILKPEEFHQIFNKPFIIHLEGEIKEPIFFSTLLHGNETTGVFALQNFLQQANGLKRSIIIFVGNIPAAAKNQRHLNNQPDYNRIWASGNSAEHQMARSIFNYAQENKIIASIDIHNNTGRNPFYACINKLEKPFINLASLFGPKTIYFTEPHEVQSNCFSNICPSLTIECGLPGEKAGIDFVTNFIDKLINASTEDDFLTKQHGHTEFYHSIARIKIPENIYHNYQNQLSQQCTLSFTDDFDLQNFVEIPIGSKFGIYSDEDSRLVVIDSKDQVVTSRYFKFEKGMIVTKTPIIPSMFTKDIRIAKEDCLGYIMQKLDIPLN